jgi:hypothetical protein
VTALPTLAAVVGFVPGTCTPPICEPPFATVVPSAVTSVPVC